MLGGSWDLVRNARNTVLAAVISIVTSFVTLVSKSHDPVSSLSGLGFRGSFQGFFKGSLLRVAFRGSFKGFFEGSGFRV